MRHDHAETGTILSAQEKDDHKNLSSARITEERVFGILKIRMRH